MRHEQELRPVRRSELQEQMLSCRIPSVFLVVVIVIIRLRLITTIPFHSITPHWNKEETIYRIKLHFRSLNYT